MSPVKRVLPEMTNAAQGCTTLLAQCRIKLPARNLYTTQCLHNMLLCMLLLFLHKLSLHILHILLCILLFLHNISFHTDILTLCKACMLPLSNLILLMLLLRFPGSLLQPASPAWTQQTLRTVILKGVIITTARGQLNG